MDNLPITITLCCVIACLFAFLSGLNYARAKDQRRPGPLPGTYEEDDYDTDPLYPPAQPTWGKVMDPRIEHTKARIISEQARQTGLPYAEVAAQVAEHTILPGALTSGQQPDGSFTVTCDVLAGDKKLGERTFTYPAKPKPDLPCGLPPDAAVDAAYEEALLRARPIPVKPRELPTADGVQLTKLAGFDPNPHTIPDLMEMEAKEQKEEP